MTLSNAAEPARTTVVRCLVDTSAVLTLLPEDVAEHLGLQAIGKVIVRLADEQRKELVKAGPLRIDIGGRSGYFDCLLGPPNGEVLLGQIVLEELDLIVDCVQQRVTPRPESPFLPLLSLK
jgi:predicted aspartyl protease